MNHPTLIIGLGGSGTTIAKTVFQNASERQKNNIQIVCMDTDKYEMESIQEKIPSIQTVSLWESLPLSECLELDEDACKNWFPKYSFRYYDRYSPVFLRAAFRLSFNTAVRRGKLQVLNSILERLSQLKDPDSKSSIQVILTGSLCGFTGSAQILPLSLYIRDYVKAELPDTSVSISGFFLLPEVFDSLIHSKSQRDEIMANTYAAMREINAFMLAADGCLPDQYDFGLSVPCFNSNEIKILRDRPMARCFLISGMNLEAKLLKSFRDYIEYSSNCILASLSVAEGYKSISEKGRDILKVSGTCRFAGIGVGRLTLPAEDAKAVRLAEEYAVPFIDGIDQDTACLAVCAVNPLSVQEAGKINTGSSEMILNENIPENEMWFCKITDSFRPSDLRSFSPGKNTEYSILPPGDCYRIYHEQIDQVEQDGMRGCCITPHLDRSWHDPAVMPDLGDIL